MKLVVQKMFWPEKLLRLPSRHASILWASSLVSSLLQEKLFGTMTQRPPLALVEECMDLFRQAAELYSAAGDPRYEEVSA